MIEPMHRRRFLGLAAGAALAPLSGLGIIRQALPRPRRRMLQLNGYAIDAETPLDLLTDYLTPNDLFFVRHHWQPLIPDPAAWRLVVDGEVASPLALSLAELKRLPPATVTCVLQCAGNGRSLQNPPVPGIQWGPGAVGNARWTGVRVKDLLQQAGIKASARHLHTFGSDTPPARVPPFHRSLEVEKALEDGVIAYEMNGAPLPPLHGGPARLVVPGWAGDHWMKWLARLSAQPEPQKGFYMDVGYRYPRNPGAPGVTFKPEEMAPVTELAVKSNFSGAPDRARIGSSLNLRGFAFSGAPDIARVEVSEDDGVTWSAALLDPRHDPYAWRRWTFPWTPRQLGRARLLARATDSRGAIQPRDPVWNQSGYLSNGWHAVEIEVTESAAPLGAAPIERPLSSLGARTPALPDGSGRPLAQKACLTCHSGDVLRQQRLTERQWTASIAKMTGWGAEVPPEESGRLIAYLVEHFGPGNERFRPVVTRPVRR
jgi:DMSO/TMAO reductase YedYZ molybdopterin-dependent catalytic subunit